METHIPYDPSSVTSTCSLVFLWFLYICGYNYGKGNLYDVNMFSVNKSGFPMDCAHPRTK